MIGEIEEANGRMEGQLLDRVTREQSLNDQLTSTQTRLTQANQEINQLKVFIHSFIYHSLIIRIILIHSFVLLYSYDDMMLVLIIATS